MSVRVIASYPSAHPFRALGRAVAATIGILLMAAGVLTASIPLVFLFALIYSGGDLEMDAESARLVAIATAIAIGGLWVGRLLLRGRRRLGLFLRRFGYGDATRTISGVVAGGAGRSWRMVTLDDAQIAPIGTARRHRRFSLVVAVLGVAVVAAALYWLFGGGLVSYAENLSQDMETSPTTDGFGQALGEIIGFIIIAALVGIVVLIGSMIVLAIAIVAGAANRAARRAQRQATVVINSDKDVVPTATLIGKRNRRILGSRLVVARVAGPQWRAMVRALAGVSDAVVIDLSQATENLVWEVEVMRAFARDRWVLVCHRDRLGPLTDTGLAPAGSPYHQLAILLDGEDVLPYGTGTAEVRRFARSLRNKLNAVALATPR